MAAARKPTRCAPAAPPRQPNAIIHGDKTLAQWLDFYWHKLQLPAQELSHLAITQDRREFAQWIGKRLNIMALGCYCYLPAPATSCRSLLTHPAASAEAKV